MTFLSLVLLPAVASAVVRTEKQQTVSISSGGKLEAPALDPQIAKPTPVVRRVSPRQLLTDSEASMSDSTECIAWHNFSDVRHETFGSNSTAAAAKYDTLIQKTADDPEGHGVYATIHFGDDSIKSIYGQPTDHLLLHLCQACNVSGARCDAAHRAHRATATAAARATAQRAATQRAAAALPEMDTESGTYMVKRQRDGPLSGAKGESVQQGWRPKGESMQQALDEWPGSMSDQKKAHMKQQLDEASASLEMVLKHEHAETAAKRQAAEPAVKRETSCIDSHTACHYWSTTGECKRNPGYMNQACKAACGQCR